MISESSSITKPHKGEVRDLEKGAGGLEEDDAEGGTGPSTATATVVSEVTHNPNELIVDWDGPDDPENPRNWAYRQKWRATIIVSLFTFMSPVSSSMMAPATTLLGHDLNESNPLLLAMMTSIFLLGPLSEIYGRVIVLQCANGFYFIWNLACSFARTPTEMIVFRFLAGLGGSAPLALGGGLLGDVWHPEQRGQAIAIYSLAPLLGPVFGPVCGAWIAQKSTWRWVFWSTCILDVIVQIAGLFFLRESFAPVLLERKAKAIRTSMGPEKAAELNVHTVFDKQDNRSRSAIFARNLIRPFAMFGREPIIQLLGLYMAFIYGIFYLSLTTLPEIFQITYREPVGTAGLHYLALGIGLTGASQFNARFLDKMYVYLKNRYGTKGQPEYRLPSMVPATILLPFGLLLAGWSAQHKLHWIVTDIGIACIGAGMILCFQCITSYVVDAFTLYAASALAATSCLRSIAGFSFPLFAPPMYAALGYGKGNTILAVVAIVIGCPAPWLFWKYGKRIRESSRYAQ
ncbi:MFS polyamine transporter [Pluteus cervinus]|uniref:MFS polyamine transporter n=1 Tax=Pluteus cervinus TaxID=181527 RepID=A0ACD3APA8_9AGAR|nr:MFS polyamine transporter [Pluteus cervinus]